MTWLGREGAGGGGAEGAEEPSACRRSLIATVWGASLGVGVTLLSLSLFEVPWGQPAASESHIDSFSLSLSLSVSLSLTHTHSRCFIRDETDRKPSRRGHRRLVFATLEGLRTESRQESGPCDSDRAR